jgi:hypothetical protein
VNDLRNTFGASLIYVLIVTAAIRTQVPADLIVDSARPVMNAVVTLEHRYGLTISYEDPPFVNVDDLEDHTAVEISKRRAISPNGGRLELRDLPTVPEGVDGLALVNRVLNAHTVLTGGEQMFRAQRSGEMLQVVPMRLRDSDGTWKPIRPILDARVSLPRAESTLLAFTERLLEAVSQVAGVTVSVGNVPINLAHQRTVVVEAQNEKARDVLTRVLNETGVRLSWRLLYDAPRSRYVLNVGPPGNPGLIVK